MGMLKNGRDLLDQGTLKSCVSHKWFDELRRLIEWFLYADSDQITFGLTTNLLCVLDISWVSTAVVLVEDDFPNAINKSLVKCGKIVSYLVQYLKNVGND